jgi:hypothetical protein
MTSDRCVLSAMTADAQRDFLQCVTGVYAATAVAITTKRMPGGAADAGPEADQRQHHDHLRRQEHGISAPSE